MTIAQDYWTARALLEWQVEMGVDEAILDAPVNRYALIEEAAKTAPMIARPARPEPPPPAPSVADQLAHAIAVAQTTAAQAASVDELALHLAGFDLCDLKKGARSLVFADGNPTAHVMIVGDAPDREADLAGRPFVGAQGQMLDRMFAAIGLTRSHPDPSQALYLTTVLPWRPPADRAATPSEIAMFEPFLRAHINLVQPEVLILMGNTACQAVLGQQGLTRLRGHWEQSLGRSCLPMMSPLHLIQNPQAKRDAWADLLSIKARL